MSLRLNGSNSGFSEITAPATAGDNTLTLPAGNGSANQFLKNSGTAGTLEFAALAGSNMPAGSILQVVHVAKTDVFSVSASSGSFSTVFSAQITPSATSSKVLVMWSSNISASGTNQRMGFRVLRDSTAVGIGDASGSRTRAGSPNLTVTQDDQSKQATQNFLDSPSTTSQVTYNLQISGENSAGTMYVNRNGHGGDDSTHYRGASHIVLMEVAA